MAENTSNLTFNILTFKHPSDEYTFHFSNEEVENSFREFHTLVSNEVREQFGEQEHYYTQYTNNHIGLFAVTKKSVPNYVTSEEDEEKVIKEMNSAFTASLFKCYYNKQIHDYFKSNGFTVNPNFVSDTEIWIPSKQINTEYNLFEKYTLKVQFGRITGDPELLIAFDGFPFPIKVKITSNKRELEKDYKVIKELLNQVYQFSRMYWKSFRQQNLPVTIKYPELVAEMFPHFEGHEIQPFGKDNL